MAHAYRGFPRYRRAGVERRRCAGGRRSTARASPRWATAFLDLDERRSSARARRRCASCATCCSSTRARRRYGAPEYGGNRELPGWRAIRYAGDVQPRGWSDEEVTACLTSTWSWSGPVPVARPPPTSLTGAGRSVCVLEKGRNHLLALEPPFASLGHLSNDEVKFDRRHFLGPDPLLEPRTYRRGEVDGDRRFTGDVNNMPSTVGGAGFHADGKLPRYREVDFRLASELGPVDGAAVADWPVDYDEMEPYYAEAERLIGVAGDHTGNPFAAWRSGPYPMPPGADMYVATLTGPAAERLGYHPYRAPTGANSVPYDGRPACNNCGFCAFYGCPDRGEGRPGRHVAQRTAHRAVRDPPRERGGRGARRRWRPACHRCALPRRGRRRAGRHRRRGGRRVRRVRDAAPAAPQRHRELVRPRRPLPDVPSPDDRARLLPVPTARVQGSRRHPPHGRPDRRRR